MLPTFLGIGAVKGGSTSMYEYLRAHPQIFMSDPKELAYFAAELNWTRGAGWYERHFAGAEGYAAVGEFSPAYAMYPRYQGVPERIALVLPHARFVYFVRDPIERMYSHYHYRVASQREHERPEVALLENPIYQWCSSYALQIDQYLEFFPPERLCVVTDQEMARDRRAALSKVYAFLGVDPDWWSEDLCGSANVTEGKHVWRGRGRRLTRLPGYKTAVRVLPSPAIDALRRVTHQRVEGRAELSVEVRRALEDRLRDDVARLRTFVGGDFDGWGIG